MRSPCHIRMYKTNINIFHNKYLSKAAKILQWQFFWSICDTSFNLPPYANYTACCLLCQRWDHCDQHLVTPDRSRLAPEMVEDLVMLKCNLRLLRNMSTVWKTYLLCLVWLRYSIYMYLPRQTSFDLRKQHLDFRLLVLVLRCLLNPIHRLLVFVSLSFCFSVFSPVCLS